MKRSELEHVIRAASNLTGDPEIVVIGSQAVLAQFPDAPDELLTSMEADVFARNRPELSIEIDGGIGERSPFHDTFGYYAHGVDEDTASLPAGWKERLVPIKNPNTNNATGWCLEVHDLAASKLVAGRPKDIHYVELLLQHKMLKPETLTKLVATLAVPEEKLKLVKSRLIQLISKQKLPQSPNGIK